MPCFIDCPFICLPKTIHKYLFPLWLKILYYVSHKTLFKLKLNAAESYQTVDESQAVYVFQKTCKNIKSVLERKIYFN